MWKVISKCYLHSLEEPKSGDFKSKIRGVPGWCSRISSTLGVLGHRFHPWPSIVGLRTWPCLQLQLRLQLWLRSDPWPGNSICLGAAKKEKKLFDRWVFFFFLFRPAPMAYESSQARGHFGANSHSKAESEPCL